MFFLPLGGPDLPVHCVCTGRCRIPGVSRHSASQIAVNCLDFFGVSETSPFIRQGHMHRLSPWPLAPGSFAFIWLITGQIPFWVGREEATGKIKDEIRSW